MASSDRICPERLERQLGQDRPPLESLLLRMGHSWVLRRGMEDQTVSTVEAAELLGVSEQFVRRQIRADALVGVQMRAGCWRIPRSSLRPVAEAHCERSVEASSPPPYVRRMVERLDSYGSGMIPCAEAAEIAGVGVKAMRNGLRSGRIPGGRMVGGCWLVTVADFGRWLGVAGAVA
jgi:excisionase family DNA binding protein